MEEFMKRECGSIMLQPVAPQGDAQGWSDDDDDGGRRADNVQFAESLQTTPGKYHVLQIAIFVSHTLSLVYLLYISHYVPTSWMLPLRLIMVLVLSLGISHIQCLPLYCLLHLLHLFPHLPHFPASLTLLFLSHLPHIGWILILNTSNSRSPH
jgi:hypothetical protein